MHIKIQLKNPAESYKPSKRKRIDYHESGPSMRNDLFNIVIIELESVHFFDSKKRFCSQKLY